MLIAILHTRIDVAGTWKAESESSTFDTSTRPEVRVEHESFRFPTCEYRSRDTPGVCVPCRKNVREDREDVDLH